MKNTRAHDANRLSSFIVPDLSVCCIAIVAGRRLNKHVSVCYVGRVVNCDAEGKNHWDTREHIDCHAPEVDKCDEVEIDKADRDYDHQRQMEAHSDTGNDDCHSDKREEDTVRKLVFKYAILFYLNKLPRVCECCSRSKVVTQSDHVIHIIDTFRSVAF